MSSKKSKKDKEAEAKKEPKSRIQELRDKWKLLEGRDHAIYDQELRVLSTGILAVDMLTGDVDPVNGNGGFCEYSIVEGYGPNNTFKSNTLEHFIRETQRTYGPESVLGVFTEKTIKGRMETFGINTKAMTMVNMFDPNCPLREGEKCLDMVLEYAASKETKLIGFDSMAEMAVSDQLYEYTQAGKRMERSVAKDDAVAARAKVWNRFIQKFNAVNQGSVLYLINQQRPTISAGRFSGGTDSPMRPTTPCGQGIDFSAQYRLAHHASPDPESKIEHPVTKKVSYSAYKMIWKMVKRKKSGPTGMNSLESIINLDYYQDAEGNRRQVYIDKAKELLVYGNYLSSLIPDFPFQKSGNGYYFNGVYYRSAAVAAEVLRSHPEVMLAIEKQIIAHTDEFFKGSVVQTTKASDLLEETDNGNHSEPEPTEETAEEPGY